MNPIPAVDDVDYEEEGRLDPSIRFPDQLSDYALTPKRIFLTGATGFAGAYLLHRLLTVTDAVVICLVRATDSDAGIARLINQLRCHGLWQEAFGERIQAVVGDIAEPCLGLREDRFRDLAAGIDAIYHGAGSINMAFPYARLKPANVLGTQEILRLAGLVRTKPVHFLSSIAVFYSDAHPPDKVLRETDAPLYHSSLRGGYSKSKWVADRLVANAQARGLPASIYRPVRIMGHSQTGAVSDMGDLLPLLLKGCVLLGKYPAFDIEVTLVPVDYVSHAIVHLASQQECWGRAYHFFNPAPIKWVRLMRILIDLGYPMEEVSYDKWWQELTSRTHLDGASQTNPAYHKGLFATLRLALSAPTFLFYKRPAMDAKNTELGLAGSGITCPPIDHVLMATYVGCWQESGYLPCPVQAAAAS